MKKQIKFKRSLALLLSLLMVMGAFMIMPASAASDTVKLDISSKSQKLMMRLKPMESFEWMPITSVSKGNDTIAFEDYAANGISEVGFMFLESKVVVSSTMMLNNSGTQMIRGQKYDTNQFYAIYDQLRASTLDHTVYFMAYAVVNGEMTVSGVRSITPNTLVAQGAQGSILGTSITDAAEIALYASTLQYFESYREYVESQRQPWNGQLKVGTYNINFGQDNSVDGKPLNLQNIANVILENDLDVIALNEVHIYAANKKSAGRHTPFEVARLATEGSQNGDTYYWAFAAGLEGYSGTPFGSVYNESNPGPTGWYAEGQGDGWDTVRKSGYGNAIISKYPIKSVREIKVMNKNQTEQLQVINGTTYERRTILIAEIDVNGTIVTVMATHFDLVKSSMNAAVTAIFNEIPNITTPIILMGDLNCEPVSGPIGNLSAGGFTFVGDNTGTHKNGKLDYIAYTNATVTNVTYRVLTTNNVSDHFPAIATLTFRVDNEN